MDKTKSGMDDDDAKEYRAGYKSESKKTKSRTDIMNKSALSSVVKKEDSFKYELPESCFIKMMKSVKIDKMDLKFLLVAHPLPTMEGEMLIFLPNKDD